MAAVIGLSDLIDKLLEPVPQYIFGCLPAIAILGESPMNRFAEKLAWVFRCLGCPFIGLFYTINIGGKKESRCIYWLSSNHFKEGTGGQLRYRPFGVHYMRLEKDQNDKNNIMMYVEQCTATASVLERLSSLVSVYYIMIGVVAGISRVTGAFFQCQSWPYIPLILAWTIPAILRKAFSGNLVVKEPNVEFTDMQIIMEHDPKVRIHKRFTVTITALISIIYPWIVVLLAFFTPPIGYGCRSKYISLLSAIWSFNSTLAYLCHWKGESDLIGLGNGFFHIWFSVCGFIVAIQLLLLCLLAKYGQWWVGLFGSSCDNSSIGCNFKDYDT
jgi:hypothetical protein